MTPPRGHRSGSLRLGSLQLSGEVPFSSSSLGLAQGNKIEWRRVAAVAVPVRTGDGPRVGDAVVDEEVPVGAADGGEEDDRHERKDGSRDGSGMVGCGAYGYASNV
ncbi:hypothetical protein ZWY2020_002524 [Hordeum vulgare]|nr:hypothetical protein ZWY2020_002524 [Hordeum vulgare]